jgi:hemoglobin-like flavoprotein
MSFLAAAVIIIILAVLIKSNLSKASKAVAETPKEEVIEEAPRSPVSKEQIEILQSTWAMVLPIKEQAAELFYGKLFEMDPELKALFKGDMVQQGEKLMTSLNLVVNSLNDLEAVVPALQDLGKRHISYGVTAAHYDTVGGALLWTLEQGLGDAFTDEARAAWTAAYGIVSKTMIDAAY